MIETPLFESKNLRLTGFEIESDAEILSAWSYDLEIARVLREKMVRPLNFMEAKKFLEEKQKQSAESEKEFYFAVRLKTGNELAGFLSIDAQNWTHAAGRIAILSGLSEQRSAIMSETIQLALTYAFEELNLFRVDVIVPEYDYEAIEIYEQAGFQVEVRQREFFFRANHYWDNLHYGIFCSEWTCQEGAENVR